MPTTNNVLRILVASPSDLKKERTLLEEVIQELNILMPPLKGVSFELIKWETHVAPGIDTDPQAVINRQFPQDYDILIVMFWSRIGTATPRSPSGTIEEFETAYQRWRHDPLSIDIMVYFKIAPVLPFDLDPAQLRALGEFRESLTKRGVLYFEFTDNDFSRLLRIHLAMKTMGLENKNRGALSGQSEGKSTTEKPSIEPSTEKSTQDKIRVLSDGDIPYDGTEEHTTKPDKPTEQNNNLIQENLTDVLQKVISSSQSTEFALEPESSPETPVEIPSEDNLLAMFEIVKSSMSQALEVTEHIKGAMNRFRVGTQRSTAQMESIKARDKNSQLLALRVLNTQAKIIAQLASELKPDIPILDDSLSRGLDAYADMLLSADFGENALTVPRLESALAAAEKLKNDLGGANENMRKFQKVIAASPKASAQFNRANSNLLEVLETITSTFDRGINLLSQIQDTGKPLLDSWRDVGKPGSNPNQRPG